MRFRPIPGVTLHARERAVARLGDDPSREEWDAAVLAIIDRTALLVTAQTCMGGDKEIWRVVLGGRECNVLWSIEHATIITVLANHSNRNPRRDAQRHASRKGDAWGKPLYRRERPRMGDGW